MKFLCRNDTILLLKTIPKADNRHNFDPVRYLHCPKILRSNTGSIQSRHKLLHNHIDIRQYLKEKMNFSISRWNQFFIDKYFVK